VKSLREVAPYKTPTSKEKEIGTPQRTMFFAKRTPGQTKLKINTTSEVGTQDFSNNLDADNRVESYMLFKEISDNARRSIELMKNDPRTPQAMRDMADKVSRGEKVANDWTGSSPHKANVSDFFKRPERPPAPTGKYKPWTPPARHKNESLNEWTERKPFYNVGINSLKNITKQSTNGSARFLIQNNKMSAGDSHYFAHDDLESGYGSSVNGYIHHDPATNKFHYAAYTNKGQGYERAEHPLLDKMEKNYGITRGIHNIDTDVVRPLKPHDNPNEYQEANKSFTEVNTRDFHTDPRKKKKSNIDPNNYDYSTPLSEITKKTLLSYINKSQDKPARMFARPDATTKSYTLAQRKIGQSQTRPKVMGTGSLRESASHRIHFNATYNEAEDVHILNHPHRNSKFTVVKNPNTRDGRDLHDEAQNGPQSQRDPVGTRKFGASIRTLKHGDNLYAWDADHSTHHYVKNNLSISTNDKAEHGFFSAHNLRKNGYDLHKTHSQWVDNKHMYENVELSEISRDKLNSYRDAADKDWSTQGDKVVDANKKIASIPSGNLSARMNAYQARSTAMRRMSRRNKGLAMADRKLTPNEDKADYGINEQVVSGGNQPYDTNKTVKAKSYKQTIAPLIDTGINEISTGILQKYIRKAAKNGMNRAYKLGQDSMDKKASREDLSTRKVKNRAAGISLAAQKLGQRDWTYSPNEEEDVGDHEYR
jgi:hypothetical protein